MFCFFFNDTATTEIYTLSLHDALPIFAPATRIFQAVPRCRRKSSARLSVRLSVDDLRARHRTIRLAKERRMGDRSQEHTSELQSRQYLVCRLLLEKKKKNQLE